MGVLTDYFRAPSRAAVLQSMNGMEHWSFPDGGFDGVELKAIDPPVMLGQLVAAILGVDWTPDLVDDSVFYPSENPPDNAAYNQLPEDDPWKTGPWISELDNDTRHALASLDADRILPVAQAWAEADEFGGFMDAEVAAEIIEDLRALAQRAEDAGDMLCCWLCL